MATWLGNFVSISGSYGARIRIETQLAGQSVAGNYSVINYQVYVDFNGSDAQLDGGWVQSSAGVHYNNGGRVYNYAGNFSNHTVTMNTGQFTIGHDNNGNASYGMNAHVSVYQSGTTTASGSEGLPSIPRNVTISYTSGNINDESNPYIVYNNPAGHAVTAWLELEDITGATQYAVRNNYVSGADFALTTSERNLIRSAMSATNATRIRYVTYDNSTGAYGIQDFTINIVNAAPTFSAFAYHDSNSATTTITGNNQYIVQNTSVLNLDVSTGNKAVAVKGASMVSYTATINAVPTNITYTTSTINTSLGTVDANQNQILSVTATDSRGNTTTVQKTVTIVPYVAPTLDVVATRQDGFGADTTLDFTGHISTITVGGTDKNSVSGTTGIGYKIWVVGGTEPTSYTNVANTTTTGTVNPTSNPIETISQSSEYNLKVKITDAVQTVVVTSIIGIGSAAFRIGTDGFIYNQNKRVFAALDLYPIGTVLIRNVNTSPQSVLGGTWTATTTASQSLFGETLYGFKRTA